MYREETKKVSNFCSIFRSCDLDLCPIHLIITRLPLLTIRHMCTKCHLDPTFCSYDIVRKRKKYQVSFRSDISFLRYCAETIVPPGHPDAIHHIISRVATRLKRLLKITKMNAGI